MKYFFRQKCMYKERKHKIYIFSDKNAYIRIFFLDEKARNIEMEKQYIHFFTKMHIIGKSKNTTYIYFPKCTYNEKEKHNVYIT